MEEKKEEKQFIFHFIFHQNDLFAQYRTERSPVNTGDLKIRKKIFFWLGENLSFSILKFSKSVLLGDFRNDLTCFDHVRGMVGDQFFDIWHYS